MKTPSKEVCVGVQVVVPKTENGCPNVSARSRAERMKLAEDVFTKAVHVQGINNWQRGMEQLLPDTYSSAFHPWLSNCPAMFSPEQSLQQDFSEVLWKLQNIYIICIYMSHYLHTQCLYTSKLIWLAMTLCSKLGFFLREWSNNWMWPNIGSVANDPRSWITTAVHSGWS